MALDAAEGGPLTIVESRKRVACPSNGSFYQALSREAGTKPGLNPTFVVYAELAQALDRELFDVLTTGFGARDAPLFVAIVTQSRAPEQIFSSSDEGRVGKELVSTGISRGATE